MLKAENRLKDQTDFSRVLKEGTRWRGAFLQVITTPNRSKLRLGIIVTKKIEKKAVGRNRLRRVISHLFEHLLREKKPSGDVVVVVNRQPETEVFASLERDINQWYAKSSPGS